MTRIVRVNSERIGIVMWCIISFGLAMLLLMVHWNFATQEMTNTNWTYIDLFTQKETQSLFKPITIVDLVGAYILNVINGIFIFTCLNDQHKWLKIEFSSTSQSTSSVSEEQK